MVPLRASCSADWRGVSSLCGRTLCVTAEPGIASISFLLAIHTKRPPTTAASPVAHRVRSHKVAAMLVDAALCGSPSFGQQTSGAATKRDCGRAQGALPQGSGDAGRCGSFWEPVLWATSQRCGDQARLRSRTEALPQGSADAGRCGSLWEPTLWATNRRSGDHARLRSRTRCVPAWPRGLASSASPRVAQPQSGSSQPHWSLVLPVNRPKNSSCRRRVTRPALPLPICLPSTARIGVISAAVPHISSSSHR